MTPTGDLTEWLKARGETMVPKAELVDGARYYGRCRNGSYAFWRAKKNCFEYIRVKFGQSFVEDIRHPDDEKWYDVFIPFRRCDAQGTSDGPAEAGAVKDQGEGPGAGR